MATKTTWRISEWGRLIPAVTSIIPAWSERKSWCSGQRMMIDRLLVKPNRLSVGVFNLISKSYRGLRRITGIDSKPDIRNGDWYGNDTAWRMVVDLNRIPQQQTLFSEFTQHLSMSEQKQIIDLYYRPYQNQIRRQISTYP